MENTTGQPTGLCAENYVNAGRNLCHNMLQFLLCVGKMEIAALSTSSLQESTHVRTVLLQVDYIPVFVLNPLLGRFVSINANSYGSDMPSCGVLQ